MRWSKGSFSLSNGPSCSRRNFEGIGHSKTVVVKGESILLTIQSKLRSIFSLIALFSSSISFLISLKRSKLGSYGVASHRCSSFLWLSPLSSQLVPDRFSSYCNRNLISWFYRVGSSTPTMNVWICRANAIESWGVLGSIWTCELNGTTFSNLGTKMSSPQTMPNW